ncbi:AAA family ATPase [Gaoshiqia sp. Z1-71]|uniref:AAA family ATPase n=1 Tax=Gaoshiqia hydrogeniformans TaxID=3290090 RepID=UPI003BF82E0E
MTNNRIIGKTEELGSLNQALQNAARGIPQVVFISGPAGIGKSTLIQSADYPETSRFFETNVLEEEIPSYSIIANFLRQSKVFDHREADAELTRYAGYFLPEYRTEDSPEADFDLLIQVFRKALATLTKQELVVWVIEDLQWADTASLDMITGLIPSGQEFNLAILATYRNEQIGRDHPLRRIRTKLRRNRWFSEIGLQPFTEQEINDFIERFYHHRPSPEFARTLHYQTGGLPLLISEIMQNLREKHLLFTGGNGLMYLKQMENFPVPENIRDLVVLQMNELSPDARNLAEIAASYSMEFPITFLEKFVSSFHVIDELIDKGIILEKSAGTGTFRHALYRETIRSEILWSRRREIYRKIAEELEKQQASDAILADFYYKAGLTEKARPAFIRLARESCELFAYPDAARWAERALSDWPKGDHETERLSILEEFVHCSKVRGDFNNALKALKEISESDQLINHREKLAQIYREMAMVSGLQGEWTAYKQYRTRAAESFVAAGLPGEAALDYMDLAERLIGELNLLTANEYAEKAVALAEISGHRELPARALGLQGYIRSFRGDTEAGIQLAKEAIAMALDTNDVSVTAEAYRRLAGTIEYASKFREAIDVYETAYRFCNTNKLDYHETQCLGCMSWVLMRLGDWKRAFDTCREIIEHKGSKTNSQATANTVLAILRSYRGEIKTAGKHLALAVRYAADIHSMIHKLLNKWAEALIAQGENDISAARQAFTEMLDIWFQTEDRHDAISGLCDATSFFALQNDRKELNHTIKALTVISNINNNPEAIGILSFAIGASLSLNNEHEQAVGHFRKALEYTGKVNIPLQAAIIRFHLGLSWQNLELNAEADECFRQAYETFKNLGVRYWCSVIDQQRMQTKPDRQLAEPAASAGKSPAFQLTDRQHEILELLTNGFSNKEIASKMNLSTRTIDMHLRNIYDRLNCRSRTEATKIAFDFGLIRARNTL